MVRVEEPYLHGALQGQLQGVLLAVDLGAGQ